MFCEFMWQRFFITGQVTDYLIIKETAGEDFDFEQAAAPAELAGV